MKLIVVSLPHFLYNFNEKYFCWDILLTDQVNFILLRECLFVSKNVPATYSPVNRVPRSTGMILIFVYMGSFVPICMDEYFVG